MSYEPTADESGHLDAFEALRRRREAVVNFLDQNDLSGLTAEDARRSLETAGFRFRSLDLDDPEPHVLTADMVAARMTATVRKGRVLRAHPG